MRRFSGFAAMLLVALACCAGLSPRTALGAVQVTVEPSSSSTTTFNALKVTDVSGGPDHIVFRTVSRSVPSAPDGLIYYFSMTSSAGFVTPLPQGCDLVALELPNEHRPTVTCDYGGFDFIAVLSGKGDDHISAYTLGYRNLTWKQIFSPNIPVYMNVFLGPGRDVFGEGEGTDVVHGGAGKDFLFGGNSNDLLFGGRGGDRLHAQSGNDVLGGGPGKDGCFGSGKDRVRSCERIRFEER